ncbi:AraC family transcriptional regulator [Paenibacillus alkaliterrae]|uniref:AraC family transcriptional regulator n=1 Tax=Paenibacillus alkaliterrae TaxID=320909 RepID=UPI001F3577CF|nr:AraC family transcriptional regulator [Paenibacillus alkaliterrae]MCF2937755.1 AraC family transcriptional regulator [Paenibacillus alkaliterrae]
MMKRSIQNRFTNMKASGRGKFYRVSLITILFTTCIPGLIIGSFIYFFINHKIETELQQIHQDRLAQTIKSVDDQFSYLELTLTHWAHDPVFGDKLKQLDFINGYKQIFDLYKTLLVMEGTHPLIQDMELILLEPQGYLFNSVQYVHLQSEDLERYRRLLEENRPVHWTLSDTSLTVSHSIPGGISRPFGILKVTLNESNTQQLLGTLDPYNNGSVFLMDEEGAFIRHSGSQKFSELNAKLKEKVMTLENKRGAFVMDWHGEKYSVSYGEMNRLGSNWVFVSAASMSAITQPVAEVTKIIIMISALGLTIALLLSWFASQWLYRPIEKLKRIFDAASNNLTDSQDEFEWISKQWEHATNESLNLNTRLKQQLPRLREGFILQLVQGHLYAMSEVELRERMHSYGLAMGEATICAVVVQLTGFSKLEGRFSSGDQGLVSFAAANMMEELAAAKFNQVQIVHFHDLWIGLLIVMPPPEGSQRKQVFELAQDMIDAIHRILKINVTISVSPESRSMRDGYVLFEEAKRAIGYRELGAVNQIIDADKLEAFESEIRIDYPLAIEKQILHALRSGERESVERLLGEFMAELAEQGKEVNVRQNMLHLLGSIQHSILEAGIDPFRIYGKTDLYEELGGLSESEELLAQMKFGVIEPFLKYFGNRDEIRFNQMVEQTMNMVHELYETDISLEMCAETMGTTSYTLSKAFRQTTGKNFIDFLTDVRLDKARELLRDTEIKVNDIAQQVGYQPSYFHRIFKKREGLSPTKFRENSRQK